MNNTLILGFTEFAHQAKLLADSTGLPVEFVSLHHFPDGESQVRLPVDLPETLVICRSLYQPNEKLIELFLTAKAARQQGVRHIILVSPYLCYMRQDKAFNPGEVISQQIIGRWLAELFDVVITVDAHLHRISTLQQAIPSQYAVNLTATHPMAVYLHKQFDKPFLLGPDEESSQWVSKIAAEHNFDYAVAVKQRFGDKDVQVSLPKHHYQGRDIVLVDDIASTGKTLLSAAQQLQTHHPASINVLVTHALFVEDAIAELHAAGVSHIWSCDSIPHHTNAVSLTSILADAIRHILPRLV